MKTLLALLLSTMMFPTLAKAVAPPPPVLSPTQELVLGDQAVAQFLQKRPETSDVQLAARVDAIGRRLAAHSDRPDVLHRALVVEGSELQAFAFLGGTVAVTEALARSLDEDELAFALAHEMAHVDLRHQPDHEVAVDVVREAAGRTSAALALHDRHAELEADRFGALYVVRAGFRFSAAAAALQKLSETGGPHGGPRHPDYADRIRALSTFETELRRALEAFDRGRTALKEGREAEAVDYLALFVASFPQSVAGRVNLGAAYLARWRAAHGTSGGLAEELPILPDPGVVVRGGFDDLDGRNARRHFEAALRLDPDAAAARAGLAMVLLREGRMGEAREHLMRAERDPRLRPEALLLLGNAAILEGERDGAVQYCRLTLRLRPGWEAAEANLARALGSTPIP